MGRRASCVAALWGGWGAELEFWREGFESRSNAFSFCAGREDMDYSNPSNLRWSVRSDRLTVVFAEVPGMNVEFSFDSSTPNRLLKTPTFPLQTKTVAGALCFQFHRIKSSRDNK